MPPPLALALTLAFVFYLLQREKGFPYKPSPALWIPCGWMMILGSRSVTEWLNLGAPIPGMEGIEEGSPLDRTVFFSLMFAGLVVLMRRSFSWSLLFRNNIWLVLFFVYGAISIFWSDFPFVAFKRWVKALGDPIMAMIILSDDRPMKALETVVKRLAIFLIPTSILFIKYYPEYGRTYSYWAGQVAYTGVTTNKNTLGYVLFICGLFFLFAVIRKREVRKGENLSAHRNDVVTPSVFLLMIVWLLGMIEAKTAWVCLVISSGIVLGLGFAGFRKYLGVCLSAGLVLFFFLELSFNISESIVATLGRDTTLTGRTDLWPLVLALATNPMIGAGFESFWLGERLSTLQDALFFKPTQAHNGYIEIYINLGWIGLLLLAGTIISSYRAMRKTLVLSLKTECREAAEFARLGMGFLIAYHIFNFTDALFKPISLLFVFFLIFAMRWPPSRPASHCLTSGNSQGIPQVASTVMAK